MINTNDRLIKARIKMTKDQPFFGRLSLLLDLKEDATVFTAGTDGENLYYNAKFIDSLSDSELSGIFMHEILHVALGHIWRLEKRDRELWNISADYAVNLLVKKNGGVLPDTTLIDVKYDGMNAESIYELLKKNAVKISIPQCGHTKNNEQDQSDQDNQGGGSSDKQKKDKKGKGGNGNGKKKDQKEQEAQDRCTCGEGHKYWEKAQKNKKKNQIKAQWDSAMEQISRERGVVPAGMERVIEELTPREDWKAILMNYLSASKSDFDFMRRDRRSLNTPFYFPDLASSQALEDVVAVLDTSGSITSQELNSFIAEIKSILSSFDTVKGWVIDCDAEVNSMIAIEDVKEKRSFYGGGGTSHIPVFDEMKKRHIRPKVMVCFTDLYTEYPSYVPEYPVLWLATQNCSSHVPPFGRVIKLKGKI